MCRALWLETEHAVIPATDERVGGGVRGHWMVITAYTSGGSNLTVADPAHNLDSTWRNGLATFPVTASVLQKHLGNGIVF